MPPWKTDPPTIAVPLSRRSGPAHASPSPSPAGSGSATPDPAVPDHSGRVAALDGIRALAVAAVLFYHAGFGWARGGFLGVDVFFVLSGYLITGLLAGEFLRTGHISLRRFYIRRARRLLPALFTVITAVAVLIVFWLPREAASFRHDAAASLTYATNWWFIAHGQSYFGGTGRQSLLLHLWSLAVEEQFYVLWPLMLIVMLRGGARKGRASALWRAFGWAILLSLVSAGAMVYFYSPWSDPSRVYYGTDTRAFELLIGVALALAQSALGAERHERSVRGRQKRGRLRRFITVVVRDLSALGALGVLLFAIIRVSANSPRLYPLGLVVICVAAAVLIRSVVAGGVLAALLALRPMVWLGERSYALYLWHWPVFDVTRPKVDVTWPSPLIFLVRIVVSLALADATFRWIERPVRSGALGRVAGASRVALRERRFAMPLAVAVSALTCCALAVGLAGAVTVTARRNPADSKAVAIDSGPGASLVDPSATAASSTSAAGHVPTSVGPTSASAAPGTSPGKPSTSASAPAKPTNPVAIPTLMPAPPANPQHVDFVGDSQGMTLLLNEPPDTAKYLLTADDTTEGCGFLGGRVTSRTGERRDLSSGCAGATDRWASRVAADHPDVAVLMSGAWDVFDDQVNGTTLPFGSAPWDQYYDAQLAQTVAKLKATGVPHIELALLPCWRPVNSPGSGYWPERGDDTRTRHINTLLTAFAAKSPSGVGTLAPPPQFCTDETIAASLAYRWDGVHYYKPGARLYFQAAIPQLLAPLS